MRLKKIQGITNREMLIDRAILTSYLLILLGVLISYGR